MATSMFHFGAQAGPCPSPAGGARSNTRQTKDLKTELEEMKAAQKPLKLTLGAEFECILAHCTYPQKASGSISRASGVGIEMVLEVLSQPLQVSCATCGQKHTFKLPLRPSYMNHHNRGYSGWIVEADTSIDITLEEQEALGGLDGSLQYFDFYPIEIKTRVLPADRLIPTAVSNWDPTHTHSITSSEEITAALKHLDRVFNSKQALGKRQPGLRLFTNTSCGMHVHVGNQHHGFPLQTVKNVLTTYTLGERQIDGLQAWTRITGSDLPVTQQGNPYVDARRNNSCFRDSYSYNVPLSAIHAQSVYQQRACAIRRKDPMQCCPALVEYPFNRLADPTIGAAANEYSAAAYASLLQRAANVRSLSDLQPGWGHMCTVNLENLPEFTPGPRNGQMKMTIEFRQRAATLDPGQATAWIDVVTSIVLHAHSTSDVEYAALCTGCSSPTITHYKHQLGMSANAAKHAAELTSRQLRRLDLFGPNDLFRPLMSYNLSERQHMYDQTSVRQRISQKFIRGGYGQQSDQMLDQLDLDSSYDNGVDERLRVGWQDPVVCPRTPDFMPKFKLHQAGPTTPVEPTGRQASSVSSASAEMVGCPRTNGDMVFTMESKESKSPPPVSPFTGERFDEYGQEADDEEPLLNNGSEPRATASASAIMAGGDHAGIHPDRLRLMLEQAIAGNDSELEDLGDEDQDGESTDDECDRVWLPVAST